MAGWRTAARFVSAVFHPLFMATYVFALFVVANPYLFPAVEEGLGARSGQLGRHPLHLLRVVLLTAFFPGVAIALMVALRLVSSASLLAARDRILPYVATGFFYIWAYWTYRQTGEHRVFQAVLFGGAVIPFAGLLLTVLGDKVSMHAAGVGGLLAVTLLLQPHVYYDITWAVFAALLAAGMTGSARLVLGVHEPGEILSGYLIGAAAQTLGFYVHFYT